MSEDVSVECDGSDAVTSVSSSHAPDPSLVRDTLPEPKRPVRSDIDTRAVPDWALRILSDLNAAGHQAFLVGGFVRDSLLDLPVHDIDVTTDARWEDVRDLFSSHGLEVLETGAKHGTVTVMCDGNPVEVTTFRTEGAYSDGRHPDAVEFVNTVEEDLSRRDFTINAMAWSPDRGVVDPFGGMADLETGTIRAVGDPNRRFEEDGLRILRALRFASRLGYRIEDSTKQALSACVACLDNVSAERIGVEYDGIVCGRYAVPVLREHVDVIVRVLPEIAPMVGLEQRSRWHVYDVWEHCLHALEALPEDAASIVRHTTLLHDIGKPECFTIDVKGHGHFYNHEQAGSITARSVFRRLRWRSLDIDHACLLIRVHDHHIDPTPRGVRRMLVRLSHAYAGADAIATEIFGELLQVKRADTVAHAPASIPDRLAELDEVQRAFERVLEEESIYRVRDLAVSGRDIIACGVPRGPEVGRVLKFLLSRVVDEALPNEREALMDAARAEARRYQ